MVFELVDCRVRDRNLSGPMSRSGSLLSLLPEGQEDPTVDSQSAATHAKHLRPFLLSSFPWHSFPPIQSSYKWKQLSTEEEVQRQVGREREEGGVTWGEQVRTRRSLAALLGTEVESRKHIWGQMDWRQLWTEWCPQRFPRDSTTDCYVLTKTWKWTASQGKKDF